MRTYHYMIATGLVLIALALVAGVSAQEPPVDPHGEPPTFLLPIFDAWVASPHAQADAAAFNRWNEADPVEVPTDCAKCHSTPGYQDFLGADGTAPDVVDHPAPIGTVVNCDACHNEVARQLTQVTFPSGVQVSNLNDAARCMVCHQGRASGATVAEAITAANVPDLNTVSPDLRFINIHYYAAAATLYGSEAHGGYEFEGKLYDVRFEHVDGMDTCIDCHDPHTLEVQVATCGNCHEDVDNVDDLRDIRMMGSLVDYDGDGDIEEGIAGEIETLQEALYATIQQYATEIVGTPIAYDEAAYPYFFIDGNANGVVDPEEANRDNGYATFTGRLVQATYNFQVTHKDPGNFAHNAKYHIQLLVDSIEALQGELGQPAEGEGTAFIRNDAGHFDSSSLPFRDWDADGEVPATCVKCHTDVGLPMFIHNGATIAVEPTSSFRCTTCHSDTTEYTIFTQDFVTFPSGAQLTFTEEGDEPEPANICINCHQGRESTVSVNKAIAAAGVGDDETSEALRFRNIHYFAAGATLFGAEAQGAYQYEGMEYNGRFEHDGRRFTTCIDCHDQHELKPMVEECADCHVQVDENGEEGIRQIRMGEEDDVETFDYDGDGDVTEPIAAEIESFYNALHEAIVAYAANTAGAPIVYDSQTYPYWMNDLNSNGVVDPDEASRENAYASWTPTLLRAAYNYQYITKDPGNFAHNADYAMQVLYDSLQAIGGDVSGFTRPPLAESE